MALLALAGASALATPADAQAVLYNNWAAPYLQRLDGISPDAGDAKAVNSATHVIDPWPRHAARRRIPANGQRMSDAVERYRDVRKSSQGSPPISSAPASSSATPSPAAAPPPPAGDAVK